MRDDKVFLSHILESIEIIKDHLKGVSEEQFEKDIKLQDAVIRRIEIIGEAAKNISEEFKENNLQIPWHKMIGIRNMVIHEYFGVKIDIVWGVCKNRLDKLKAAIKKTV